MARSSAQPRQLTFVCLPAGLARGLVWTCPDDCKYQCMWKTVDAFVENGIDIPQFYGKVSI